MGFQGDHFAAAAYVAVVPAKAGTHNHRAFDVATVVQRR